MYLWVEGGDYRSREKASVQLHSFDNSGLIGERSLCDKFYHLYCVIVYLFGWFFLTSSMTHHYDRPWSTQPHTQREMAQLKTRQEQVHVLISMSVWHLVFILYLLKTISVSFLLTCKVILSSTPPSPSLSQATAGNNGGSSDNVWPDWGFDWSISFSSCQLC